MKNTKIHLVFCCNIHCLEREMALMSSAFPGCIVYKANQIIVIGNDQYKFFLESTDPERFSGLVIHDYRCCNDSYIDKRLTEILNSRIRQQ